MKKLFLYVFLVLMICNRGIAQTFKLENCYMSEHHNPKMFSESLDGFGVQTRFRSDVYEHNYYNIDTVFGNIFHIKAYTDNFYERYKQWKSEQGDSHVGDLDRNDITKYPISFSDENFIVSKEILDEKTRTWMMPGDNVVITGTVDIKRKTFTRGTTGIFMGNTAPTTRTVHQCQ